MNSKHHRLIDPAELTVPRVDENDAYQAAAEIAAIEARLAETRQRRERAS